MVVHVHDSALEGEDAVSSTFISDASQNLMITVTVQLSDLTSMSRHAIRFFVLMRFSDVWSGTGRSGVHHTIEKSHTAHVVRCLVIRCDI